MLNGVPVAFFRFHCEQRFQIVSDYAVL
jgi:hypothetical protein